MTAFLLPDLGEGLKDADLVEWLVKEGQSVALDELVLLVETAKAVVELPAPSNGIITRLAVAEGETVKVGQVLFEYEEKQGVANGSTFSSNAPQKQKPSDQRESVSVVGKLSQSNDSQDNLYEIEQSELIKPRAQNETNLYSRKKDKTEPVCINAFKELKAQNKNSDTPHSKSSKLSTITPQLMAFARKLGLQEVFDHTYYGEMSLHDLLNIYQDRINKEYKESKETLLTEKFIPLKNARKVMAKVMTKSHQEIPTATIFEDADISDWSPQTDITLKLIKAISMACIKVPILNAWYNQDLISILEHQKVDLGLAVNSARGLYVPVIRQVNTKTENELRSEINNFKQQINDNSILANDLIGATISLSNFGVLSGRYATPIIVPPQVCIVGVGKSREEALVKNGKIQAGRILPISISFDHRAVTGAEAAQFMQCLIETLETQVNSK